MGQIYANIELTNTIDVELARMNIISASEIKQMPLKVAIDTGATLLSINENIQYILKFPIIDRRKVELANGQYIELDVAGHVGIKFKNRTCIVSAFILPGDTMPLLGNLPMEEMDLVIMPQRQLVDVNPEHPDYAVLLLK